MTKILVIDDIATNRKLVSTLLAFEGYDVAEAADGADGLVTARREQPDLIISDILMPSMDGYEFVRRLRAESSIARTLVMFYTANYHEREAQSLATQCQVARVVVKPCASADFLRIVKEVLTGASSPAAKDVNATFDAEHLRLLTNKLSQKAEELKVANSRLAALIELNVQLASERDTQTLLQKVCEGARNLLGARYAILAVHGKPEGTPPLTASSGIEIPALSAASLRIDSGLLGRIFKERQSRRAHNSGNTPLELGLPEGCPLASAALGVPVSSLTRTYGWICLLDKLGAQEFSAADERLLTILGAQFGRIYENGSLYSEVQNHAAQLLVEIAERERTVSELRKSEAQFRQLAENIDDVLFLAPADLSKTLYVSPAYERVWGRPAREVLEDPLAWLEFVHPDDRERTVCENHRIAAALPASGEMQFRIVRPDGTVRWILNRLFPILGADGSVLRAVGIATDITERKQAEDKIVHLNRVYSMLSSVNSLIVRATDRAELLREACRLSVEQGRFRAAWCGLRQTGTNELSPVAWAGELTERSSKLRVPLDGDSESAGLIVTAMTTHSAAICNDLRDESARVVHREDLAELGFRAAVILPLVTGDEAIGCIGLLTDEVDFFDDEEMHLLNEFSSDIAFALDHIEKAERLEFLAYHDSLTGLANRTLLEERVGQHVNAAQRGNTSFALVIADPERFDALNDAHGRQAGDRVLSELASRFTRCAGSPDLVARIGSDQFAAVVPAVRSATDLARTLEMWWRDWLGTPFDVNGQSVALAARAGIALFPSDGSDAITLIRSAEAALKSAKGSGKTQAFYTAELSERLAERLALEKNMRRGMEQDEFVLHYQPKVDLDTRRVKGLEALIRWKSAELGLVPPGKFISLMEDNGMIVDVGAWALRQATLDRSRWLERGLAAPRVAVNVSTVQLRRDDFVRTVTRVLRLAGRDAGLDIEVTESLLMEDVAENLTKLRALRDLGVGIALDDFGTGYSSLGYLAKLPVHTLKIDRSFVAAMLDDPSAMTLVSTIISLARTLKLESVAEGVESEDQAKILRLLRCDEMQGYLISKPLPFDEMTIYLSRTRT